MNDPLFGNKLAFAVIFALLLFFGLPQLSSALIGGGHHSRPGEELHLAYPIEFQVDTGGADVEKEPEVDLGALLAEASPDAGKRRVAGCASCHSFEQGGSNGVGPNLWGIVERQVAEVAGFNYSSALKEFGGVWSYDRLDKYLENSKAYVPGTNMNQRYSKPTHRAEILAYLSTLHESPVAFPEPLPAAPVEAADAGTDEG
ncbi:MAG: c-type cytochrome [Pseudomonadota bacterium]